MYKLFCTIKLILAMSLIVVLSTTASAQQSGLDLAITPVENGVEVELRNISSAPISFLRWETPFEPELTQDVFAIAPSDGKNPSVYASAAMFSGRLFKRASPGPEDFLILSPGASISAVVPLAEYYQLSQSGNHSVSYRGVFQLHPQLTNPQITNPLPTKDRSTLSHSHDDLDAVFLSTSAVTVDLTPAPEALYARAAGYSSCSASQQAEIAVDFDASEVITREAREALEGLPVNQRAASPRYLHWFGAYTSERYNSVLDTYTKAEALMANGEVEFNCDCDEPYFAFIRRTEPYRVNLCTYYWRANRNGTDSRAGTILHEVSHFNEIGGTSDFAYGAADVSALAVNNPANAVHNADSIEYFAENTPFRELSAGPAAPEVSVQSATLVPGTQVTGQLPTGGFDYYQVEGVDEVLLTTVSGDADLYVYSDSSFVNLLCSSQNLSSLDSCDIGTADTIYISVFGYEDSSYGLVVSQDAVSLQAGQSNSTSINTSEWQQYTVSNAGYIQIESFSGDADLYVYSSAVRDAGSLVCDSRNASSNSVIDGCEINGSAYIAVYGVQAGQYAIAAFATDPGDIADPPGPVVVSQTGDNTNDGGGGLVSRGILTLLFVVLACRIRIRTGKLRTGQHGGAK